jgi:hypothetical protein
VVNLLNVRQNPIELGGPGARPFSSSIRGPSVDPRIIQPPGPAGHGNARAGYLGVSDAEMVELTVVDLWVQLVLGPLDRVNANVAPAQM